MLADAEAAWLAVLATDRPTVGLRRVERKHVYQLQKTNAALWNKPTISSLEATPIGFSQAWICQLPAARPSLFARGVARRRSTQAQALVRQPIQIRA